MSPSKKKKTAAVRGSAESARFFGLDQEIRGLPGGKQRGTEVDELEHLRRSYSTIQTLLQVSASITSILELGEVLNEIVDAVVTVTGCDRGFLMLKENGTGLSMAVARSRDGEALSRKRLDISQSVVQKVAASGEPMIVTNTDKEAGLRERESIVAQGIKTVMSIPLKFDDNLVGVIYADSNSISETFTTSDLSIMNAFGALAAVAIENARRHGELEQMRESLESQNVNLRREVAKNYSFSGMVGRSREMQAVFETILKVAPLSTTVLIQGETGTGKELIAKAIHYNSPRKGRPIVTVNCGALPKNILESELFGYRKGSFTGADDDRPGLFEAADGGTIFLDEIGDMPVELQVKLLRVLQEGEVRRVGDDHSRKVDVRIISASNRNLAKDAEQGVFRNDLFYRLNVVPIYLPPLRDRQEDILPLAEFFLDRFSKAMKKDKPILTRTAKELLLQHRWEGNVRELENAIERALALGEGKRTIDVHLFEHLIHKRGNEVDMEGDMPLKVMLMACEKEYIRKMLIKFSWNISRTATALKVSRQQLHYKIKRFNLTNTI